MKENKILLYLKKDVFLYTSDGKVVELCEGDRKFVLGWFADITSLKDAVYYIDEPIEPILKECDDLDILYVCNRNQFVDIGNSKERKNILNRLPVEDAMAEIWTTL